MLRTKRKISPSPTSNSPLVSEASDLLWAIFGGSEVASPRSNEDSTSETDSTPETDIGEPVTVVVSPVMNSG